MYPHRVAKTDIRESLRCTPEAEAGTSRIVAARSSTPCDDHELRLGATTGRPRRPQQGAGCNMRSG